MSNRKNVNMNIFRILRTCLGLSINEMAKLCGVSAIYLSELELGKKTNPSKEIIKKIADACEIKEQTINYFIEKQTGESLNYQQCLLESLERLAEKLQNPDTGGVSTDLQ